MSIDISVTSHSRSPPTSQSVSRDLQFPPRRTSWEILNSDRLSGAGNTGGRGLLLALPLRTVSRVGRDTRGSSWGGPWPITMHEEETMTKLWAVVLVVVSLLFVAPLIESGTSESSQIFQSVGNAEGGGG